MKNAEAQAGLAAWEGQVGCVAVSAAASQGRAARYADRVGAEIIARKSLAHRKALGLYLTPVEVAEFMARMVDVESPALRILDPAAGSGTLLCAVVEELASRSKTTRPWDLELVAYETDPDLARAASSVLEQLKRWAAQNRMSVRSSVRNEDFLRAHADRLAMTGRLFRGLDLRPFDIVVANPPYLKLAKSDPRARAAISVVHGQPNIYALFMATAATMLRDGGEFVFITPRSFTSGAYFRLFREKFFSLVRPVKVHVFNSRRSTFDRDGILQENIILKGNRDDRWYERRRGPTLLISVSDGPRDLSNPVARLVPMSAALEMASRDKVLRLPVLDAQYDALRLVESWSGSLHRYDMEISTGPVVPFRAGEFLDSRGPIDRAHAPLLWMHHVHPMRVCWPNNTRKPQYVKQTAVRASLLVPNRNYVLLRRFSAKEETRRLVAAPWSKGRLNCPWLGIENHLNYVYRPGGELCGEEAWGLAALLNSTLLDCYFRASNGNTQVSATELRAMRLPPHELLIVIGERARAGADSPEALDEVVRQAVTGGQ